MKKSFLTLVLAMALCSCNETTPLKKTEVVTKEETPEALQDGYSISKVSRMYSNIMEDLYQELLDKDEALKKLDDEIEWQKKEQEKLQSGFDAFNSKSNTYYTAASASIATIKDVELQRKIKAIMEQHQQVYKSDTKNSENWLDVISKKRVSLSDHHTAMKIALTLNVMASYQKNEKPDVKAYQTFAAQEDSLISVIKKKIK